LQGLSRTSSPSSLDPGIAGALLTYNLAAYVAAYAVKVKKDAFGLPQPYDFKKFPFIFDLYSDPFPHKVIKKGTQLGVSEYAVFSALHAADKMHCDVMYGFPHANQIGKFSHTRIKRLILGSDYFRRRFREDGSRDRVSNTFLMQIGDNFLYLVGVASDSEIQSNAVDYIIRDEFDYMDQNNAETLLKRNDASDRKMFLDLGFPTISGFGIDAQFEDSDQREYEVRCDSCGTWQEITWPRNVDQKRLIRVCHRCAASLERPISDAMSGRWVARNPGKSEYRHGYHIHRLLCPALDFPAFLKLAGNTTRIQEFYNFELGLAWAQKDIQITRDSFLAAVDDRLHLERTGSKVYGGVDVGKVLHAWFERTDDDGKRLVDARVFSGENKFEQLAAHIKSIQPVAVCVDLYPESTEVTKLVRKMIGTVWAVAFQDFTRTPQVESRIILEPIPVAEVNRTMLLDNTAEDFAKGRITIPGEAIGEHPEMEKHFTSMMRVTQRVGTTGVPINRWVTPEGVADHWSFARAAAVAASKLEEWLIKQHGATDGSQEDVPEEALHAGYEIYRRKIR